MILGAIRRPLLLALSASSALPTILAAQTLAPAGHRTRDALVAVSGTFGVAAVIGILVLVLAEAPLLAVARSAARDMSKSFWAGVLWQLLAVPILAVLCAGLAVTVVGLFAIPFAILAWALAYAGALTLGLLSVAYVVGRAIGGRGHATSTRAIELRAMLIGIALLFLVWAFAALLVTVPFVGVFVRIVALALFWAAATAGLGAVVRSRGGRIGAQRELTLESAIPSWQTPTPVGGVVAAKRPVSVDSSP